MIRVTFTMAAWLICSPIFGQIRVDTELKIVGPTAPVQVREIEQLQINGLDASKLKLTRLVSYPRDGVRLIAAQSWQGEPLLLFSSKVPGKVLIAIIPPPEQPDTIAPYAEIEITVEGDGPKPQPNPDPGPNPKPQPDPQPTPIAQVWAVIVYESGQDMNPAYSEVLRGKALQDWFATQGWKGPDGLPSLVRIDQNVEVGVVDQGKKAWIEGVKSVVKEKASKLPQLAWCGTQGGKVTVEDIKATVAEQIERFKQIAATGK